ncbi:hypothetical protein QQ045_007894 [Rhodiola kirilowii]
MVHAGDIKYYGVLQNVIELKYAEGMPVVIFQCKWFNTDESEGGNIKMEHGILSIDASNTWYEDGPYCLGKHAQQVFYLEDPKFGDNWKVDNVVVQRGTYSHSCVGTSEEDVDQEDSTLNIPPYYNCNGIDEEVPLSYNDFFEVDEDEDDEESENDEGEADFDETDDEEEDVGELHYYYSDHEVSEEDQEDEEGFDDIDEE